MVCMTGYIDNFVDVEMDDVSREERDRTGGR